VTGDPQVPDRRPDQEQATQADDPRDTGSSMTDERCEVERVHPRGEQYGLTGRFGCREAMEEVSLLVEVGRLTLEWWLSPRLTDDRFHRWPGAQVVASGGAGTTG
jgi:hypothetical protein